MPDEPKTNSVPDNSPVAQETDSPPKSPVGPKIWGGTIAGFIFFLLSIPPRFLVLPMSILALVLGVVGFVKAHKQPEHFKGKILALITAILAVIRVGVFFYYLIRFHPGIG